MEYLKFLLVVPFMVFDSGFSSAGIPLFLFGELIAFTIIFIPIFILFAIVKFLLQDRISWKVLIVPALFLLAFQVFYTMRFI